MRPDVRPWTTLQRATLFGALLFIAIATLVPGPGSRRPAVGTSCVLCGEFGTPDLVLNILLFIPLGITLGMRRFPAIRALGAALLLSAAIESFQLVLPGRSSTLRDVLTNALGGGLGALIALRITGWLAPGRRAVVLLWVFTISAVASVGVTGLLLRPDPTEGPYYAHWTADHDYLARWTGTLDSVFVAGRPVPPGRIRDSEAVREAIGRGAEIRITGRSGAPTRRLNGIFTISDVQDREVLLVGGIGDALVIRSRRLAARFRLHTPHAEFAGLMGSSGEGTPFTLSARGDLIDELCVRLDAERECAHSPPAGSVWTLFLPMQTTPPLQQRLFDLLTFFSLALPVALWGWSVPATQGRASLLVLAVGLTAAAGFTQLALPGVPEWTGVFLAVLGGRWLAGHLVPAAPAGHSVRSRR